jgi:hypothetical protein
MATGEETSTPLFATKVEVTLDHLPESITRFEAPNTLVPAEVEVIGVAFCLIWITVADAGATASLSPLYPARTPYNFIAYGALKLATALVVLAEGIPVSVPKAIIIVSGKPVPVFNVCVPIGLTVGAVVNELVCICAFWSELLLKFSAPPTDVAPESVIELPLTVVA